MHTLTKLPLHAPATANHRVLGKKTVLSKKNKIQCFNCESGGLQIHGVVPGVRRVGAGVDVETNSGSVSHPVSGPAMMPWQTVDTKGQSLITITRPPTSTIDVARTTKSSSSSSSSYPRVSPPGFLYPAPIVPPSAFSNYYPHPTHSLMSHVDENNIAFLPTGYKLRFLVLVGALSVLVCGMKEAVKWLRRKKEVRPVDKVSKYGGLKKKGKKGKKGGRTLLLQQVPNQGKSKTKEMAEGKGRENMNMEVGMRNRPQKQPTRHQQLTTLTQGSAARKAEHMSSPYQNDNRVLMTTRLRRFISSSGSSHSSSAPSTSDSPASTQNPALSGPRNGNEDSLLDPPTLNMQEPPPQQHRSPVSSFSFTPATTTPTIMQDNFAAADPQTCTCMRTSTSTSSLISRLRRRRTRSLSPSLCLCHHTDTATLEAMEAGTAPLIAGHGRSMRLPSSSSFPLSAAAGNSVWSKSLGV